MNDLSFDGYGDPDDIFGFGDEIVGNAGLEEIIGAAVRQVIGANPTLLGAGANSQALVQSPAFQQAVARNLARTRPIMQKTKISKKRVWPLAFGPTDIPAGQSTVATANPQVYFLGRKLINTGDVTGLYITQITVGNQQQLPANTNPISVRSFGENVLENAMKFDTCQPALTLSLTVANLDTETRTWSMTLFGIAAQ